MQNKAALWLFTALLSVACIYQLSFTWVVDNFENDIADRAMAKVDSVKTEIGELTAYESDSLYQDFENDMLVSSGSAEIFPVLNFDYRYCKQNEINLGLDLQGGMHVTLEVSVVDLIKNLAGNSKDETFVAAIEKAQELQKSSQEDFATLFSRAVTEIDPNFKLAGIFHGRDNKEMFPLNASNEEVIEIIKEQSLAAVKNTEQVLRKRIDNLGVVQPKIQRLAASERIIVELPGIKDKKRVRKILQGTAKLEFWETYDNTEVFESLSRINDYLAKEKELKKDQTAEEDSQEDASVEEMVDDEESEETVEEDGLLSELSGDDSSSASESTEDDLLAELQGDSATSDSASLDAAAQNNPLFNIMQPVLGRQENGQNFIAQGPVVGYVDKSNMRKVDELLSRPDILALLPARTKLFWSAKPIKDQDGKITSTYQLFAIKVLARDGKAKIEGDAITNARVDTDPMGQAYVSISMNSDGSKEWREMTKIASEQTPKRSIAIVLDDRVYSAPTVQGEIPGGNSQITGQFSPEEAADLANVLKAGKLPAPANIIEEAVVGPSLGSEAIRDGLSSFIVALLLVLVYMAFYYARAGVVADIALLANVFFVLGVLASIGATLTLPGIAGIVLTIGMSVDANVLIYERIREEINAGKGMKLAIVDGYNNAYSSIIDANVTTFLTGLILFVFGTGPIKGFASTLLIGILTSLFSAIFITRLIFEWRMENKKPINFGTKMTNNAFKNLSFSFIKNRKKFYIASALFILVGIGSFFTNGFNQGVDFTGGRSYLVRFESPVNVEDVSKSLGDVFVSKDGKSLIPEVKIFGSSNQVKITTNYMINEQGTEVDDQVETKLKDGLTAVDDKYEVMSSQKVEPTIADDIKQSAIWAVLFSLLAIFLYILVRFKKWTYGLGALGAVFHDVLIVLSIFSLFHGILPFSLEIDQAFIAAILTVVGYSINDTVVVFDRIREYLGFHKKDSFNKVVNDALNSTLSRTINTSLSTILVLLMIFIFGGEVIRGFVFALLVGVVVGTYSSVCIAAPTVVALASKEETEGRKDEK